MYSSDTSRYKNINPNILRQAQILINMRENQTICNYTNYKIDKYKHMCAILDKGGESLITGHNIFKTNSDQTEHAEAMAIRKFFLKFKHTKRRITVDFLVIRTNGSNSKPCAMCLEQMRVFSYVVNVKNIYYSHEDEPSGIRKEKFSAMINSDNKHYSSYYRHKLQISQSTRDTDSITSTTTTSTTTTSTTSTTSTDTSDSDSDVTPSRNLRMKQKRRQNFK